MADKTLKAYLDNAIALIDDKEGSTAWRDDRYPLWITIPRSANTTFADVFAYDTAEQVGYVGHEQYTMGDWWFAASMDGWIQHNFAGRDAASSAVVQLWKQRSGEHDG